MTINLEIMEECDMRELLETPELTYMLGSILERKKIAKNILKRKSEELLFINSFGFHIDSVFAGLNEKHIEYFAKYAPDNYKKSLVKILRDQEMMKGVWEIAKSMDDDDGDGSNKNQKRIKMVIQYILDNWTVFQF